MINISDAFVQCFKGQATDNALRQRACAIANNKLMKTKYTFVKHKYRWYTNVDDFKAILKTKYCYDLDAPDTRYSIGDFPLNHIDNQCMVEEPKQPMELKSINQSESSNRHVPESMDLEDYEQPRQVKSRYALLNIDESYFDQCKRQGIWISVLDAIKVFQDVKVSNVPREWEKIKEKMQISWSIKYGIPPQNGVEIKDIPFPDRLGRITSNKHPCAKFNDLLKILSMLPGPKAAALRSEMASISSRASAGDLGMAEEIKVRHEDLKDRQSNILVQSESSTGRVPKTNNNLVQSEASMDLEDCEDPREVKSNYALMNLTPEDFEGIDQRDGWLSVVQAIAKFRDCSYNSAKFEWVRFSKENSRDFVEFSQSIKSDTLSENAIIIKPVRFKDSLGRTQARPSPCVSFKDLLRILMMLSGKRSKALVSEAAHITTRCSAGDLGMAEEIKVRNEDLKDRPELQATLQSGIETASAPQLPQQRQFAIIQLDRDMSTHFGTSQVPMDVYSSLLKVFWDYKAQERKDTLAAQERERKDTLAAQERERKDTLASRKLESDERIKLAEIDKELKLAEKEKEKEVKLKELEVKNKKVTVDNYQYRRLVEEVISNKGGTIPACNCCCRTLYGIDIWLHCSSIDSRAPDDIDILCGRCARKPRFKPHVLKRPLAKQVARVWYLTNGVDYQGQCFCCNNPMTLFSNWHRGHIKSRCDGGPNTIHNLRAICQDCNTRMGTMNMMEFKRTMEYPQHRNHAATYTDTDEYYFNRSWKIPTEQS